MRYDVPTIKATECINNSISNSYTMRKGPIDYDLFVWCRKCGVKNLKSITEFRTNFGYKCPHCGNKCRSKARNPDRQYPFERMGTLGRSAIHREIIQLGQKTKELE